MAITREEVLHVASLCRIGVTEDDLEQLPDKLSQVLDLFQKLEELNTTDVPPTGHSASLESVMRSDKPEASAPKKDILANTPRLQGDMIRVKAVLEE